MNGPPKRSVLRAALNSSTAACCSGVIWSSGRGGMRFWAVAVMACVRVTSAVMMKAPMETRNGRRGF